MYNFSVFCFVSLEVATAALKIFCVMIPSLVDTSADFGLFRVVRPYQLLPYGVVNRSVLRLDRTNRAVPIVKGRTHQFVITDGKVRSCYVTSLATGLYIPIICCLHHAKCWSQDRGSTERLPTYNYLTCLSLSEKTGPTVSLSSATVSSLEMIAPAASKARER